MKLTKIQITLIITIILLIIAAGYIINKEIVEPKLSQINQEYYNQGMIDLYNNLIFELKQCKQVPIKLNNNQTVNVVLVECLNQ